MIDILEDGQMRFIIKGDNIDELIKICLTKIRMQSREFYERELKEDLIAEKKSLIDHHAGMGYLYNVILI